MWNKVTKNLRIVLLKISTFSLTLVFENALSQLNSLMTRLISPCLLLCSARSLVKKVMDIQYESSILQKLSGDDNLDAVKSAQQSQLSNWVVT